MKTGIEFALVCEHKDIAFLFWDIFCGACSQWGELASTMRKGRNFSNKRVRNLAVSKEPWDISEVIRDKHRINKNIPWLGPQKKYSSRASSAAEKACLVE